MAAFYHVRIIIVVIWFLVHFSWTKADYDQNATDFRCAETIENAHRIDDNCSREENNTCDFVCNHGFQPTGNTKTMQLICTRDGWNVSAPICTIFKCSLTFGNARANDSCARTANSSCEFTCDSGYIAADNSTGVTLNCTEEGWNASWPVCTVFQCDRTFGHAHASDDCSRTENTKCNFTCSNGYTTVENTTAVTLVCARTGWNPSEQFCKEKQTSTTPQPKGKGHEDFTEAIAIGLGTVLLVGTVLILSALYACKRRDRFRFANFANVVIKFKTSQIGLDNPSYSPEDDDYEVIGKVKKDDTLGRQSTTTTETVIYDTPLDTNQSSEANGSAVAYDLSDQNTHDKLPLHRFIEQSGSDDGYLEPLNSLNRAGTLDSVAEMEEEFHDPEGGEVSMETSEFIHTKKDDDSVVLTTESWETVRRKTTEF